MQASFPVDIDPPPAGLSGLQRPDDDDHERQAADQAGVGVQGDRGVPGRGGPAQGGQFILAMSPEIISGKDTSAQTEEFLKKYNDIEGTRLPGLRRHENRKNIGLRAVNAELINTITNLA